MGEEFEVEEAAVAVADFDQMKLSGGVIMSLLNHLLNVKPNASYPLGTTKVKAQTRPRSSRTRWSRTRSCLGLLLSIFLGNQSLCILNS